MDVVPLFDSPVFVTRLSHRAEADRELARRFTAEALASPGVSVSNRGGWHSVPDLALRPEPLVRGLAEELAAHFREATERVAATRTLALPRFGLMLTAWAMVMRDGDYTVPHDHPEATWSSAYYLDPGDAAGAHPESGHLAFLDPRRGASNVLGLDLFPATLSLTPEPSMLVIFPGWLQHWVHPYRGARPRVAIAANASLRVAHPPDGLPGQAQPLPDIGTAFPDNLTLYPDKPTLYPDKPTLYPDMGPKIARAGAWNGPPRGGGCELRGRGGGRARDAARGRGQRETRRAPRPSHASHLPLPPRVHLHVHDPRDPRMRVAPR